MAIIIICNWALIKAANYGCNLISYLQIRCHLSYELAVYQQMWIWTKINGDPLKTIYNTKSWQTSLPKAYDKWPLKSKALTSDIRECVTSLVPNTCKKLIRNVLGGLYCYWLLVISLMLLRCQWIFHWDMDSYSSKIYDLTILMIVYCWTTRTAVLE